MATLINFEDFSNLMFWKPHEFGTSSEFENVTKLFHQCLLDACQLGIRIVQKMRKFHSDKSLCCGHFGNLSISWDKQCSPFLWELFPLNGNIDVCTMLLHPLDINEGLGHPIRIYSLIIWNRN